MRQEMRHNKQKDGLQLQLRLSHLFGSDTLGKLNELK